MAVTHDTGENGAAVLLQCSQSSEIGDGLWQSCRMHGHDAWHFTYNPPTAA